MRALIVDTGRRISPFGDSPREAAFAAATVGEAVDQALARRGFAITRLAHDAPAPADDGPMVLLAEHTYVSDKALGDFLELVLGTDRVERLAFAATPSSDYTRPVSSVHVSSLDPSGPGAVSAKAKGVEAAATARIAYDCFFVPKGKLPRAGSAGEVLDAVRASASPRVVPKREIGIPVRMPLLGDPESTTMVFPVTSSVACHVEHWVHVLWLNHLAFGIRWMEIARAHKVWSGARALAAFPYSRAAFLRSFVRRGKNVRIHPSAHVEASILGDNVTIGARATVRNSILGDGVEVGDHASVIASTVGARAFVTPKSFVVWSTAYPESVATNLKMQMCVLGHRAAVSTWAGMIDAKFKGHIAVLHDGEQKTTERSFLGSCIGHDAFVGAKVLIHPGREVPNGVHIAMRPDEIISEIPPGLEPGVPMVRDSGTLVPLDRLLAPRSAS